MDKAIEAATDRELWELLINNGVAVFFLFIFVAVFVAMIWTLFNRIIKSHESYMGTQEKAIVDVVAAVGKQTSSMEKVSSILETHTSMLQALQTQVSGIEDIQRREELRRSIMRDLGYTPEGVPLKSHAVPGISPQQASEIADSAMLIAARERGTVPSQPA